MSLFNPFDVLDDAEGAALSRVPSALRAALLKAQKADAATRAKGLAEAARWLASPPADALWDQCVIAASRAFVACAADEERGVREAAADVIAAMTAHDRRWAANVGPGVLWAWAGMAEKAAVSAFAEAFPRHRWPAVAKVLGRHAETISLEPSTAAQTVTALAFVVREAPEALAWARFANTAFVKGERTCTALCDVLLAALRSGHLAIELVVVAASDAVSIPPAMELVELGAAVSDLGRLSAALASALSTLPASAIAALPKLERVLPSLANVLRTHIQTSRTLDATRASALWRTLAAVGPDSGDICLLTSTTGDVNVLSPALQCYKGQSWFASSFAQALAACSNKVPVLAAYPSAVPDHVNELNDGERAALATLLVSRGFTSIAVSVFNSADRSWSDPLINAAASLINRKAILADTDGSGLDELVPLEEYDNEQTGHDKHAKPSIMHCSLTSNVLHVSRLNLDTRLRLCLKCNTKPDNDVVMAALDLANAAFATFDVETLHLHFDATQMLLLFMRAFGADDEVLRAVANIEPADAQSVLYSLRHELNACVKKSATPCLFILAALSAANAQCDSVKATDLYTAIKDYPNTVAMIVAHFPNTWLHAFPPALWDSVSEYVKQAPFLQWDHPMLYGGCYATPKPPGCDLLLTAASGIEESLPTGDDFVLHCAFTVAALSFEKGAIPLPDSFWRALLRRVDTDAAADGLLSGKPVTPTGGLYWLVSARLLSNRPFPLGTALSSDMAIEALATHAITYEEVDFDAVPIARVAAVNATWPRDAACMILVRLDDSVAPAASARFLCTAVQAVRPEVWDHGTAGETLRAHAVPRDSAGVALARACVSAGLSAYVNSNAAWDAMVATRRPDVAALVDDLAAAGVSFEAESTAALFSTFKGTCLHVEQEDESAETNLSTDATAVCQHSGECSSQCPLLERNGADAGVLEKFNGSTSSSVASARFENSATDDTTDGDGFNDASAQLEKLSVSVNHDGTVSQSDAHDAILLAARRVLVSHADSVLERARLTTGDIGAETLVPWDPVRAALLRGSMAALDVFLSLADGSEDPRLQASYVSMFRESIAPQLLGSLFDSAPWGALSALSSGGDAAIPSLPHAAQLLVRVFKRFPASVRAWLAVQKPGRLAFVRSAATKHLCPFLSERELGRARAMAASLPKSDALSVRVEASATRRAIAVSYTVEESSAVSMFILLPPDYPLSAARAEGTERLGVSESRWRAWLLAVSAMLSTADAPIVASIRRWREDVERSLAGIEPCSVCYCVLHASERSLPGPSCGTCKHRFHAACLYRWFKSSGGATCPMCRALF